MTTSQVRIALPSKGRMEGETLDFLAECGMRVAKTNPRQYSAVMPAFPNVEILFQRPRDIPVSVAAGDVDLGITGLDTFAENDADPDQPNSLMIIHEALGYGECSLVLAVPDDWAEVVVTRDLQTRLGEAKPLRVATKYIHATRQFLDDAGLNEVKVVYADGALEAAPNVGYADFIADITSTGTTLRENNLRPLTDGTIFNSQAIFIGNRQSLINKPDVLMLTEQMLEFFEAHLHARGQYMIFANMRGATHEEVAEQVRQKSELGGLQFPTIAPLITHATAGNWWSINLVVKQRNLYRAVQQIREIGGSGVVVTPVSYIFEEEPARIQKLLNSLPQEEVS